MSEARCIEGPKESDLEVIWQSMARSVRGRRRRASEAGLNTMARRHRRHACHRL